MKKRNPKKNLVISWIVMGIGALLAMVGFLVIVSGIVCHFVTVKCPYCGHSLSGYRPFPKECPKCHKKFGD